MRLQKYMAQSGVNSRRKCEDLILQGKVKINSQVVTELGTKVDSSRDFVEVEGQLLSPENVMPLYLVMNRPRGYITSLKDPEGRPTVMDLCKDISERIYPIGRLDYHSEGLLLLTNDGDFAQSIIHPSKKVEKVYEVKLLGILTQELLFKMQEGVKVRGVLLRPKSIRIIKFLENKTWIEVRLEEGKNRQIRKICEGLGLVVDKLKRVAIGGLDIKDLAPGKYYTLSKSSLIKKIQGCYESPHKTVTPSKTKKLETLAQKRPDQVLLGNHEKFKKIFYKQKLIRETKHS